ncbi:MAG: hypothetical protein GY704_08930 [Phycisphaeraceae bacterium]|nr:hypothetical protein [Phycisphaeraceae bacterium]
MTDSMSTFTRRYTCIMSAMGSSANVEVSSARFTFASSSEWNQTMTGLGSLPLSRACRTNSSGGS